MKFKNFLKNNFAILTLIVLGVTFYAFTIRGEKGNFENNSQYTTQVQTGQVFESSHERAPYAFMLSLLKTHSPVLSREMADFGSPDVGFLKDKFYSYFPIGVPLLILPAYVLGSHFHFGLLAAYSTMPILALFSLILLYQICRKIFQLPIYASILAPLVFGFASTSWSYAITIYQHTPTVFFLLLCFYSAWKFVNSVDRSRWAWATIIWFCYGFSIFIDYPNAILFAPIIIYALLGAFVFVKDDKGLRVLFKTSFVITSVVFLVITIGHLYYNQHVLGSWKRFHNTLPRYTTQSYITKATEEEAKPTQNSLPANVFKEENIVNGFYRLLVAPDKGILFFSPIFFFVLLGIFRMKLSKEVTTLWAVIILNIFLYASFGDPWGGWAYGPRYIIPSMAVLSIFVGVAIAKFRIKLLPRIGAFILIAYSSAVALVGVLTTNLVPPKVEADFLHLQYNYLRNINFLKQGKSGSFIYNTYLASHITLIEYFWILYVVLMVIFFVVIFVLPRFEKNKPHELEGDHD